MEGIFVNTGRSIWFRSRSEAQQYFGSSAAGGGKNVNQSDGDAAPPDAHWATSAHAQGLDSVQIESGADGMPEFIVTTKACLSQPEAIRTCPPVPLRTGEGATLECRCSNRLKLLNCDYTLDGLGDDVARLVYPPGA